MGNKTIIKELCDLNRIFEECGGKMFLLYGTALGAYRDGKPLPGDEDIDIGSFDVELRDKIADLLRRDGFDVDIVWDEFVGYRESEMIHARRSCHVDIFFFRKTDEGFVACRSVAEEPFVLIKTNKTEPVKLSGKWFEVLSPPEEYLSLCYEDWRDPTKRDHGKLYHDLKGIKFKYERYN